MYCEETERNWDKEFIWVSSLREIRCKNLYRLPFELVCAGNHLKSWRSCWRMTIVHLTISSMCRTFAKNSRKHAIWQGKI